MSERFPRHSVKALQKKWPEHAAIVRCHIVLRDGSERAFEGRAIDANAIEKAWNLMIAPSAPKTKIVAHVPGGNCHYQRFSDVCTKHDEPRGECGECPKCPQCNPEVHHV